MAKINSETDANEGFVRTEAYGLILLCLGALMSEFRI